MTIHPLISRLANNLRALRRERGMTREELANTAEVDAQLIKRIESGNANPALIVLSRLTAALTFSLSLVLGGDLAAFPTSEVDPFDAEAVGETISALRRHRQLSRSALAKQADLRPVTLGRYESATADPRVLSVEPIALALGLGAPELIRAIEQRHLQVDLARGGWHEQVEGVQFRQLAVTGRAQLWEWRLAPQVRYSEEPSVPAVDEIATAMRGDVHVEVGQQVHRLRRGGSLSLSGVSARTFTNSGHSTARLLRFQVSK
ncbi:MAG: helix-turn-helix transcriptional regulator [Acidobacteriota bacterium]